MKILNICYSDYANFMYDHTMALRSVGLDAHCLKAKAHPFGYANQAPVVSWPEINRACREADVIQVFHSCLHSLHHANQARLRGCKVVITVWHTGSPYRRDPQENNELFNPVVDFSFTDQCEFAHLGAKNLTYMATAVDIKKFRHLDSVIVTPRIFAHYPSNPDSKGTREIVAMMAPLERKYKDTLVFAHGTEKVSHDDQLKRMQQCDVYIELFKPTLLGKPYGCYGVTAFEAAAMRKVVVTNNIHPEVYREAYGLACPFVVANTPEEFEQHIEQLVNMGTSFLKSMQVAAQVQVELLHSYEATGRRWRKILSL